MLKDAVSNLGVSFTAVISLVLFFTAFLGVVLYVITRPKQEIERQANIPIDPNVVEPRTSQPYEDSMAERDTPAGQTGGATR